MADTYTFTANGTSKEDVKTQVRGDRNHDCPASVKSEVLSRIDAEPMEPGYRMRLDLSGPTDGSTYDLTITTEPS